MPRRALAGVPDWVPGLELDSADLRKLLNMQVKATQRHHGKKKKKKKPEITCAGREIEVPPQHHRCVYPLTPQPQRITPHRYKTRTEEQEASLEVRMVDSLTVFLA